MERRGPSLREEEDNWRRPLRSSGRSFMMRSSGVTPNDRFPPIADGEALRGARDLMHSQHDEIGPKLPFPP